MNDRQVIAHNFEEKIRTEDVILHDKVSFDSLLLPECISRGLSQAGFRKPSPIQFKALPLGRCGLDLIVKSKSGTGKTLVFSVIALEAVKVATVHPQVLIVVPTREIAVQIQEILTVIGSEIPGLQVDYFIGGTSLDNDIKKAKRCHIAVGAPGRLKHLILEGHLKTKHVRLFALDEADRLMEPSFQSDINEIYNSLPQRKQMIATSATYPKLLESFLTNYMVSPTHVSSELENAILLGLKQFAAVITSPGITTVQVIKAKNEYLNNLLVKVAFTQCLIFSNFQARAESISNFLNSKGWNSTFISGAQSQTKRLEAVNNLKQFKNRILLSTDLTSRGIDAANVDLVINYDIPQDAMTYLHRMGRAGRFGSSGICINLALAGDELKQVQTLLGTIDANNLSIAKLPSLDEVEGDLSNLKYDSLEKIHAIIPTNEDGNLNKSIYNQVIAMKDPRPKAPKIEKEPRIKSGRKNPEHRYKLNIEQDGMMGIINKTKKEFEDISVSTASVDTATLWESLAADKKITMNGDGPADSIEDKTLNFDPQQLMQLLGGEDDSEEDSKKRKRDSKDSNERSSHDLHEEKKFNSNADVTFCRNKTLLGISRLLDNPEIKVETEITDTIDTYLNMIKADNSTDRLVQKSDNEISNLPCNELKNEPLETDTTRSVLYELEDVFSLGYKCAVGIVEGRWTTHLPLQELEILRQACQPTVSSESESDDEEPEDYEAYGEDEEPSLENEDCQMEDTDISNNGIGPWVPVVRDQRASEVSSRDNHFNQCFDECSNNLWQNGLAFETVSQFDDWFLNQWQQNLQSVRSYVQQNIYVEEMSKYQQNKYLCE